MKKYYPWISVIFRSIGGISLCYYGYLSLRYGIHDIVFSWTFLIIGILCMAIGVYEKHVQKHILTYLPKSLRIVFMCIFTFALFIFILLEAMIIQAGSTPSTTQGNTLIVLGAQLNGSDISRLLQYRLEATLDFHKRYPDAMIIVSGGQGNNETISEASAMKNYLLAHGISEHLIIMEQESRNTYENFAFSKRLLKNDTHVSVISNDFHMFRSGYICKHSGLSCSLYPAKSDLDLSVNFYFREFFATVKDIFLTKLQ